MISLSDLRDSIVSTTTTVFSTITEGETIPAVSAEAGPSSLKRRTTRTVNVPPYATGCEDGADYASACECFGASASLYIAPKETFTSTISETSWITVQGDSQPYTATEPVSFPTGTEWTASHTFYEVELPTFASMPDGINFPAPTLEPECIVEPSDSAAEFVS